MATSIQNDERNEKQHSLYSWEKRKWTHHYLSELKPRTKFSYLDYIISYGICILHSQKCLYVRISVICSKIKRYLIFGKLECIMQIFKQWGNMLIAFFKKELLLPDTHWKCKQSCWYGKKSMKDLFSMGG